MTYHSERGYLGIAVASIFAILLVIVLAVVGWQLGWWLKQSATNHQNHINRSSYEFQTAQQQDMRNIISQVAGLDAQIQANPQNAEGLTAQKKALEAQFCADTVYLNGTDALTPDLAQFKAAACSTPAP